jgi:hypothetical protein
MVDLLGVSDLILKFFNSPPPTKFIDKWKYAWLVILKIYIDAVYT